MKRPIEAIETTEQSLLKNKMDLTVKSVDMLMFRGPVGEMLKGVARMVGLPSVSIGLILPTKSEEHTRNFLVSLISITSLVLDDQVGFEKFTPLLAEHIKTIQVIAEEEGKK